MNPYGAWADPWDDVESEWLREEWLFEHADDYRKYGREEV